MTPGDALRHVLAGLFCLAGVVYGAWVFFAHFEPMQALGWVAVGAVCAAFVQPGP